MLMRMLNRIKYGLLTWLLNDICIKTGPGDWDCRTCAMNREINIDGLVGPACFEDDVFRQARKVWGLEDK